MTFIPVTIHSIHSICCIIFHPINMPQLLQFIVNGQLGCFRFLLTTSDSSRTFLYTSFAHVYAFLWGIYLVMEYMGHREYLNICSSSNCYYFSLFLLTHHQYLKYSWTLLIFPHTPSFYYCFSFSLLLRTVIFPK